MSTGAIDLDLAGLQALEIQEVIDQDGQPFSLVQHDLKELPSPRFGPLTLPGRARPHHQWSPR
jgi:hypothetical protein